MKLFIDTASLEEIQQANDWGILDGVTTNPTLIAAEGVEYKTRLKEICKVVTGPVSAEVIAADAKGMLKEADAFLKIAKNITIKLPCTMEGLKALKSLSDRGAKTNMTLCFQSLQALLVAKLGATFVSPFVGRLDDIEDPGSHLLQSIRTIYDNYAFSTQILAASIRSNLHLQQAAEIGCDVATVPFKVLKSMVQHPLTDIGVERFLKDWESAQKKLRHEDI